MPEQEKPIQPEVIEQAKAIGHAIDGFLNPNGDEDFGFAVLIFKMGEVDRMNYISNATRADMLAAMKEFIACNEGRHHAFNPMVKQ